MRSSVLAVLVRTEIVGGYEKVSAWHVYVTSRHILVLELMPCRSTRGLLKCFVDHKNWWRKGSSRMTVELGKLVQSIDSHAALW
jgi:hypothetical protein